MMKKRGYNKQDMDEIKEKGKELSEKFFSQIYSLIDNEELKTRIFLETAYNLLTKAIIEHSKHCEVPIDEELTPILDDLVAERKNMIKENPITYDSLEKYYMP